MWYRLGADLVLVLHLAFVLFVVAGGLLVMKWPALIWLHVPAVAWGAFIEYAGWICPLTPLENELRALAGSATYHADFVEHYLLPLLYPAELTRHTQLILGTIVIGVNVAVYGWFWRRRLLSNQR